jgi:hypothetical protein
MVATLHDDANRPGWIMSMDPLATTDDQSDDEAPAWEVMDTPAYHIQDARRCEYKFSRTMLPCVLVNPAFKKNVPPILRRALRAAKVRSHVPVGIEANREWVWVGMDGAIYLHARRLVDNDDEFQGIALLPAHGHES